MVTTSNAIDAQYSLVSYVLGHCLVYAGSLRVRDAINTELSRNTWHSPRGLRRRKW